MAAAPLMTGEGTRPGECIHVLTSMQADYHRSCGIGLCRGGARRTGRTNVLA